MAGPLRLAIREIIGEARAEKEEAMVQRLRSCGVLCKEQKEEMLRALGVVENYTNPFWVLLQGHLLEKAGNAVLLDQLLQDVPVETIVEWIKTTLCIPPSSKPEKVVDAQPKQDPVAVGRCD